MLPACDGSGSCSRPAETCALQFLLGKKFRRLDQVHCAPVDVPACFIGLTPVESRGLQLHFSIRDTPGEDVVGDVSGILPVVTDGRLRYLQRARSMREGYRPQGRVAGRSV